MAYKKFSPELYRENDSAACDAVLSHLTQQGSYAVRNPDKYGPDILLYRGFKPGFYIECEVKKVWRIPSSVRNPGDDRGEFPYSSIQLPERKKKFLNSGLPIEFWILREDLKFAVIIAEESLSDERLVEVPNKYVAEGERFYQIPLSECQIKEL